ncbi:MAG TPA: alpha-amylase family glycosyl hydrolase [Methylococcus sp.]|nr:alpha-amylase family glycosyl hydrolase [Methylococcus sp.]
MTTGSEAPWWKTGIFYEIYTLSYQDQDGDGFGDLPGILRRLDHLRRFNATGIWLTPFYPSPLRDFGYDVADYTAIHPRFGTFEDFDRLLAALHAQGMKLILDFVANHTSDQHPWFQESRGSRHHPKRDWYIWRDPAPDGGPPNNWLSFFGGPAWTLDEKTGQYYLHQFTRWQPELNYRNPEVLQAILDCMHFWLRRGVDGFRVDVLWLLMKDPEFRDEPENPDWDGRNPHERLRHIHTGNLPEVHRLARAMRAVVDAYENRVLIGETHVPVEDLVSYYGRNLDECHLPFNFGLLSLPWQAQAVRSFVERYEAALPIGAWPNWVLGNHDQPRLASRLGTAQVRVAAMLLLTLRGTPTWYYGDEIGMENVPIPRAAVRDPQAANQPEAEVFNRDEARTPMQWDDSPNAGFAPPEATPWLPVAADHRIRNVSRQIAEPGSLLQFVLKLTALRQHSSALMLGEYASVLTEADDIFAYTRKWPGETRLVVLNFGPRAHALDFRSLGDEANILLSTRLDREGPVSLRELAVRPNEGLVLHL